MKNALLFPCLLLAGGCTAPAADVQPGRIDASVPSNRTAKAQPTVPGELRYFVGTWLVAAVDPATRETLTISYKVEASAGGRWLAGRAESADLSVSARDIWGLDPANGDILRFVFDGSGAYGMNRSPGWKDDRLVFEGETQTRRGATKVRQTIEQIGPNRFDAVWEALQDGRWQAYSIEQVRRQ